MSIRPIHILVRVNDVAAAVRFYEGAFAGETIAPETGDAPCVRIADGRIVLTVLPEDAEPPEYQTPQHKGRIPRLEYVVDDIEAWISRFVHAGGTTRARVDSCHAYVQVVDPFGHLWAFASSGSTSEAPSG